MRIKRILGSLLFAACVLSSHASGNWSLQGVDYTVDTVKHCVVGPGTTLTVVDLKGPVVQRVFYTVTDLSNPNVALKTICGNDELKTSYTIPAMVTNHADNKNVYFAGVNADLFSSTGPIGNTVVDGEIYKIAKTSTDWFMVAADADKKLYYGQPYTTYRLYSTATGQMSPKGVNVALGSNDFIIYTSRFGSNTGTTSGNTGVEVRLEPIDGGLKSAGTTKMKVVTAATSKLANSSIPADGFVLSANASWYMTPLQKLAVGDTVEITPTFTLNSTKIENIEQMAGGCPVILVNGAIQNNDGLLDHLTLRRPRTSIGTDATGTKMVMLVVDGDALNAGVSAGCGSKDLAAMMLAVGCTNAINFDGGGSSTMYTSSLGVQNVPSDGGLRKVRSGWFITTPNDGDEAIATIRYADFAKALAVSESYTPVIYGYNAVDLLVNPSVSDYALSCRKAGAAISTDGKSVSFSKDGLYNLIATQGSHSAILQVKVGEGGTLLKGDVNEDGIVNVSDVTALVNRILGDLTYSDSICDVNGDGRVDVSDATAIISLILN